MPEKTHPPPRRNVVRKGVRSALPPALDDQADILPGKESQPAAWLQAPWLPVQRQQAAASLGRVGGNQRLGRLLMPPEAALQRQEVEGAAPADETPTTGSTAAEVDAAVQAELEGFLTDFSNIEVTVRWVEDTGSACVQRETLVPVHPPYFMNVTDRDSAAAETLDRYDDAVSERGAANRTIRDFI